MRWGNGPKHPLRLGPCPNLVATNHVRTPNQYATVASDPFEFTELNLERKVLLLLDVPNGLRCGELFALQWSDFNFARKEVAIKKSIWKQHVGPVYTHAVDRKKRAAQSKVVEMILPKQRAEVGREVTS